MPDRPVVDDPEPGAKMLKPSRMPLSPDPDEAGEARLCRAPGSVDNSCDNVLCPVPAWVAAASVTAAAWAVGPAGVGDLLGLGKRSQLAGRRRGAGIAVHRRRILRPHFHVLGFGGRDRRGVLTKEVGRDKDHQLGTVRRDHRRGHRGRERGLVGRHRRLGLCRGLLGLRCSGAQPRHVGRDRSRHRRRRRTVPCLAGQLRKH